MEREALTVIDGVRRVPVAEDSSERCSVRGSSPSQGGDPPRQLQGDVMTGTRLCNHYTRGASDLRRTRIYIG